MVTECLNEFGSKNSAGTAHLPSKTIKERGTRGPRARSEVCRRMGAMTERRIARRYDLSLPVIIRVPAERVAESQKGKTRDVSTRAVYFALHQNLQPRSHPNITLTL